MSSEGPFSPMVAPTSTSDFPLEHAALKITSAAQKITRYLQENGLPQPSFDKDAPKNITPCGTPDEIVAARIELMSAAQEINRLALGPTDFLSGSLAAGFHLQAAIRFFSHFKVFTLLPLEGATPYSTIASLANVPESYLKRLARFAMTHNVFHEPIPNHIAHTAFSALIATDPDFNGWAAFQHRIAVPMSWKLVEAVEKWGESSEKSKTAYNIALETELPCFEYFAQPENEELSKMFSGYMRSVNKSELTSVKNLIKGFDWASLPRGSRVIDVGGSTGHISITLAEEFPMIRFTVQDHPSVIATAPAVLASLSLPDHITSRITFQPHDFFLPQPTSPNQSFPASIYLLRMILHDWPDAEARRIIAALVPSLEHSPNTTRIVIMDTVLPAPGTVPKTMEAIMRLRDLTMLQAFNARERELEDWKDLLKGVDERLRIKKVVQPVGSAMAVLEVGLDVDAE